VLTPFILIGVKSCKIGNHSWTTSKDIGQWTISSSSLPP
jgi:hypothetical protein